MCVLCRTAVDSYMNARDPNGPFLGSLRTRIALSQQESIMQGTRYNVPLLNALVFYVGIEVITNRCLTTGPCGLVAEIVVLPI